MSKMTARWLCALPRRLQRYLIEVSIIATVLIVIVTVIEWNRWAATSRLHYDSEEDSSFYHFYEGLGDGKPSVLVEYSDTEWKDLVKDGRRRTLNTSEGLITVKDMMLVPKYPLPNGANLYKSMASSLGEDIGNGKDSPPRGLDNLQGARRSSAVFPQGNSNCTVLPCTEYLSDEDAEHFQQCSKISMIDGDDDELLATCSFRPPDPKLPLVALASSPGSGMDLLRWFLQEVTGFCTGSVQCNTKLRMAGYVGESLQTTAVLGVKMDKVDPLWNVDMETSRSRGQDVMHTFDSAVYLLRNPFHTILEEWNQQQADLVLASDLEWESFVCERAMAWQKMLENWLVPSNKNHSVLVVRYEDLETHPKKELFKIMKFLNTPYSVTKLVGMEWNEAWGDVNEGMDTFEAHHIECVNLAITRSAETLIHTQVKNVDLASYRHKLEE